jgi:hypothetical protein
MGGAGAGLLLCTTFFAVICSPSKVYINTIAMRAVVSRAYLLVAPLSCPKRMLAPIANLLFIMRCFHADASGLLIDESEIDPVPEIQDARQVLAWAGVQVFMIGEAPERPVRLRGEEQSV